MAVGQSIGYRFEREIRASANRIPGALIYKVKNTPGRRNPSGIGHIDYVGHILGDPVALELKATTGDRFRLSSVKDSQRAELANHWQHGALSFLLVRFWLNGKPAVLAIPDPVLESFYGEGAGSVPLRQLADSYPWLLLSRLTAVPQARSGVLWDLTGLVEIYNYHTDLVSGGRYELRFRRQK